MRQLHAYAMAAIVAAAAILCGLDAVAKPSAAPVGAATNAPTPVAPGPINCKSLPTLEAQQRCEWAHPNTWGGSSNVSRQQQQAWTTAMPKPLAAFCMRSSWDRWYSSWLWWIYAKATGKPYPHPPVWKWMANTPENFAQRLPDQNCAVSPMPPEPDNAVAAG